MAPIREGKEERQAAEDSPARKGGEKEQEGFVPFLSLGLSPGLFFRRGLGVN